MPENTPDPTPDPERKDATTPATPATSATPSSPPTPAPPQGEKVADKPHRHTIWLGLLAAAVTLFLGLLVYFLPNKGERLSYREQEIAQQPYLAIAAAKFDFLPLVAGPPPHADNEAPGTIVNPEPAGPVLGTDISVTLQNNGNTAAEFLSFKASFDPLPDGWSLRKRLYVPDEKPSYLQPKSSLVWHYHQPFNLTPEA